MRVDEYAKEVEQELNSQEDYKKTERKLTAQMYYFRKLRESRSARIQVVPQSENTKET